MRLEYPGGIIMETSPLESTGGKVWNASIRFFEFIRDQSDIDMSNSKTIELGSGCGWLGLRLCKEFPSLQLTMTEQKNFGALEWLNHNVGLNPDISVSTTELDWVTVPESVSEEEWDFIIGSELVYSYDGARLLPSVISKLLRKPNSVCYYAHSLYRFEATDEVLLAEFSRNGLKYTVVYGQEHFDESFGSLEDLFPELELVVFKLVRSSASGS